MSWSPSRIRRAVVTWAIVAACFFVVALLIEVVLTRSLSRVATDFMITAAIVIGIQTFVGNSGILSFGHVSFFAIGSYAAAIATMSPVDKASQMPALPGILGNLELGISGALVLAIICASLFAAVTGGVIARMKASVVPMATLAFLVVVYNVINVWDGVTHGAQGVSNVPVLVDTWVILICCIVIVGAALLFSASPWGLRLQATREDEAAATSLGISIPRARFIGWLFSAILVGGGAALWALNNRAFSPGQFSFDETFALLAMLVVGGIGSVSGAFLGALVIAVVTELMRSLQDTLATTTGFDLPGLVQLATATLIIVVLILRPRGITAGREFRLARPTGGKS